MLDLMSFGQLKEVKKTLAIGVCEGNKAFYTPQSLQKLSRLVHQYAEVKAKAGHLVVLHNLPNIAAKRVLVYGLGERKTVTAEKLRQMAGRVIKECMRSGLEEVVIALPAAQYMGLPAQTVFNAAAEGALLANHTMDMYKEKADLEPLGQIGIMTTKTAVKGPQKSIAALDQACQGSILARQWVSAPPNFKRPSQLAQTFADAAADTSLKVTRLEKKDLQKEKCGALLAVAQGSDSPAQLVLMEHHPKKKGPLIALVGKGVSFDSGGLNLKPGSSLQDMKGDMAGAAAVAATLISAARMKLPVNIVGAIPIVENMVSSNAYRPGDIITSRSGKTIEIGNTDAEGRLILADTLSLVNDRFKPDLIVDLATLTGACLVALGEKIAGLFCADDDLAQQLLAAADATGERCWRLPMPEDYRELLKSDIADISNIGKKRWGGAITAALFLSEFVGDTTWAHLDIAGPAFNSKADAYTTPGGTGFGVRLLLNWLKNYGK
jgi:leucyl aminopeptidase